MLLGDRKILEHRELGKDARSLKGAREPCPCESCRVRTAYRPAVERDVAGIAREVAGDQIEGGGLAGAVRADQRRDAALLDREVASVDGRDTSEALRQPLHREQSGHGAAAALPVSDTARRAPERAAIRSRNDGRMPRGRSSITIRKTAE